MNESIQKWLERNRPPRVKITYDVETAGAIEKRELPFVLGMLADLSGDRPATGFPEYASRKMEAIDRDNFNAVMAQAAPRVELGKVIRTLPKKPGDDEMLGGTITFSSMDDFEPAAVVQAVDPLADLYRLRGNIRMLQSRAESAAQLARDLNLLLGSDAKSQLQRKTLQQLLAPPSDRTDTAAAGARLAATRKAVCKFAVDFALAATDAARAAAAATVFGETPASDAATIALLRKFIGLYAATDTPDHRRAAKDQLTALASLKAPASDPQMLTAGKDIAVKLGYNPADDADAADAAEAQQLTNDATKLLAVLDAPPDSKATDAALLAYADAQRAALVHLGLPMSDESKKVTNADPVARQQERHVADSRWFANNILMGQAPTQNALRGTTDTGTKTPADPKTPADTKTPAETKAPADAKDAAADTGKPGTQLQAAARQSLALADMKTVIGFFDDAGLQTDDERQAFVAPLGFFTTAVLAPLDARGGAARKPMSAEATIDLLVNRIDELISKQLRAIMHAPQFQAVEATWRGMFYLVSRAETGKTLKLFVFNATQQELLDDLEKAVDKDQSHLFKMIYEQGYGTLGGQPYSLLVGGYEVGRSAQHLEFLTKMSEVAAAAHAPFITAASPSIFGLPDFRDLGRPRDLEKIFEGVELAGFRALRDTEDSRYVTLVLPHVLLRLPYGARSRPAEGLSYEEAVDARRSGDFLWGSAAWLLAERITHAYSLYGWTAAIRGVEGGGLIQGLPLYTYPVYGNGSDAQQLFCPTEVSITDRREKELSDLGFIALCHCMGTGTAAFFGGQTLNQPKVYVSDAANANARLSAQLPYMLAASRFAHYIKVMMRDKIGSFLTRKNVENFLNTWIAQYVLLDENAPQDAKASYPLSQAEVVVKDIPGEPGSYQAVVFLRPHFQLEELTTSIRLVATLPAGG